MSRSILHKWFIVVAPLGVVLASGIAEAQYPPPPPPPPPPAQYVAPPPPPPPTYVATVEPVYYQGRPVYWYQNHWYYRDGDHWSYYRDEPRELHDHRMHAPPPRQHFRR